MRKRYKESKRHTIQVDYMPYKVSLEKEIKRMKTGKKPTPAEVLTKA